MTLVSRRFRSNSQLQMAAQNNPPLRHGTRGAGVALMQDVLVELGYPMPISTSNGRCQGDGIYGDETTATVRKFQRDQNLSADGIAGRDTLHRLDSLLARKAIVDEVRESQDWAMYANWT